MVNLINESGAFNVQQIYGNKSIKQIGEESPTKNERLKGINSIFAIETVEEVKGLSSNIIACINN